MRKIIYIIFFVSITCVINGQIVQVYETTKNNNLERITNKSNIIDINARLEVSINKDSLIKKVSINEGINEDMLTQLNKLNLILTNQIEILKSLRTNFDSLSDHDKIKELGNYSIYMSEFLSKLNEKGNEDIRKSVANYYLTYGPLRKSGKLDTVTYPNPQTYALKKISEEAGNMLASMGKSKDFEKIKFQLLASINSGTGYPSRVHIENFDNYSQGEFYEVPRWVTTFSDEDIAQFTKTKNNANQLNTLLDYNIDDLHKLLKNNFTSVDCFRELLIDIEDNYKKNIANIKNEQQKHDIEILFNDLKAEMTKAYRLLSNADKYDDDDNALMMFNNFQETIINAIDSLPYSIDTIIANNRTMINSLPDDFANIIKEVENCTSKLKDDINTLKKIANVANNLLGPFKKTSEFADKFSDKVISFDIDKLPEHGYINLKTTGHRKNGYELVLRLKIIEEDNKDMNNGKTIELKYFELQQLGVYSISKVTLILAIPYADSKVELLSKNRVQFAPSGSLLFKLGARNCRTWNYLNPGAGFNISTPDFDMDGTPDIGFGAIITVLKDIVSFGWSYNINTDSQYLFVGLSIPINLPGLPINTIKNKGIQ
jgi:hypothetical protein